MQIRKLAKSQQLFSTGFRTDQDTLEVLLSLQKPQRKSSVHLTDQNLHRASVFQLATHVLGDEMTKRKTIDDRASVARQLANSKLWQRSYKERDTLKDTQSPVAASGKKLRPRAKSVTRMSMVLAEQRLQRQETLTFVNPALLNAPQRGRMASCSGIGQAPPPWAVRETRRSVSTPVRRSRHQSAAEPHAAQDTLLSRISHSGSEQGRLSGAGALRAARGSFAHGAPLQRHLVADEYGHPNLEGVKAMCQELTSMMRSLAAEVTAVKSAVLYSQFQIANSAAKDSNHSRQKDP